MNSVRILDCTLRDGGYCNDWRFGKANIQKIINGLIESNVDIIECGYITQKQEEDSDRTQFVSVEQMSKIVPYNTGNQIFVGMINFGEYDIDNIPPYSGKGIEGIRVCFSKKKRFEALEYCKGVREKGYKLFIQGMVSLNYTDEEFIEMIHLVNEIKPYAFYIVDSFGMMKSKDLIRLFYMVEHNLDSNIRIGFHSHNNMQLAYSNAQTLVDMRSNRDLIIDCSIYGMGRGAGNLNTELFIEYLNDNYNKNYQLKPLLVVIDDILNGFYQKNRWGYSLPNYISAKHNAHPNYAGFLDDKKTLTIEDIENIFQLMDPAKKYYYDKNYMAELYTQYLASGKVQDENEKNLEQLIKGKKVLLVAPGKSSLTEKDKIVAAMTDNMICISVNFDYDCSDFVFISNIRRFRELEPEKRNKCIITSNITASQFYIKIKYSDFINDIEAVKDNAGLMAISFLLTYDVDEILLAGFDGYSHDLQDNYAYSQMELISRNAILDAMNEGMTKMLTEYAKKKKITFVTTPKYINIGRA